MKCVAGRADCFLSLPLAASLLRLRGMPEMSQGVAASRSKSITSLLAGKVVLRPTTLGPKSFRDYLAFRAVSLRDVLRSSRRLLGLSPMQKVLRELEARQVDLASLRVLELFGGTGKFHTLDFASRVSSLEVWEIDSRLEGPLKRNLPGAVIRIVDSHSEIKRTGERFDLVIVDNPMSIYDGYCEHFDLFPDLFRLARDEAILLLNVIPSLPPAARKKYPYIFNEEQCSRRLRFYGTEEVENLSWEQMVSAYRRHAGRAGFALEWSFSVRRHFVYYLCLKIRRTANAD
jgi:hypothetical protein